MSQNIVDASGDVTILKDDDVCKVAEINALQQDNVDAVELVNDKPSEDYKMESHFQKAICNLNEKEENADAEEDWTQYEASVETFNTEKEETKQGYGNDEIDNDVMTIEKEIHLMDLKEENVVRQEDNENIDYVADQHPSISTKQENVLDYNRNAVSHNSLNKKSSDEAVIGEEISDKPVSPYTKPEIMETSSVNDASDYTTVQDSKSKNDIQRTNQKEVAKHLPQQTYASILKPTKNQSKFLSESKARNITNVAKSISISAERLLKAPQRNRMSSIISHIRDEHYVRIETNEGQKGELNIVVRGRSRNVDVAIDNLLTRLSVPDRLSIPSYVPLVLLKSYSDVFDSLENKLECRLNISAHNRLILIFSCSTSASETAMKSLNEFFLTMKNITVETLKIPKVYHAWIRGPRSVTIDFIRRDTNTNISMPSLQSSLEEIVISGQHENVKRACASIHKSYSALVANLCAATFDIPKTQQQILREDNFLSLDKILEDTNVSVELPTSPASTSITLRGCNNSSIGEALTMIHNLTNCNCEESVQVPFILHSVLRSKLPVIRNNIQTVALDLSRDAIIVKGSISNVYRTSEYLRKLIDDMMKCIKTEVISLDSQQQQAVYRDFKYKCSQYLKNYNVILKRTHDPSKITLEGQEESIEAVQNDIMKACENAKSEIVKVIKVDRDFHGKIIGTKGSKISEIKALFNVTIAVPAAQENKNEITIRGPSDEVERCVLYINDFVEDMKQSDYVEDLVIPKYFHRLIIGHKGIKIQEIRRSSNAVIDIPLPDDPNETIRLRGTPQEVEIAKNKINLLVNNRTEEVVDIPTAVYYYFIRNNAIMDKLKRTCNNVQLIRPSSGKRNAQFILRGDRQDVLNATDFLHAEISKATEQYTAEIIELSALQKSFIQNNCSDFMSKLASDYDVTILNNTKDSNVSFQFCGKKENVKKAQQIFFEKLGKIGDIIERKVKVPNKYHSRFLRRDGSLLEQFKEKYSIEIIVPSHRSLNENFILQGNHDSVQSAEEKIMQLIKGWQNEIRINVPCDFISYLKANMRSVVGTIEFQCNVQIDIVEKAQESKDDISSHILDDDNIYELNITGSEDDCKKASDLIAQNAPIEIFLDVPKQYHSKIIGRQGIEVNRIKRTSGVSEIIVPNRDNTDFQSPILIRGNAKSVRKAEDMILHLVNQSKASMGNEIPANSVDDPNFVTCTVDVPKHIHPRIIGRAGRTINRLRQEYNVEIMVPALGSDPSDTNITLCGLPENCERAQNQIKLIADENYSDNFPMEESRQRSINSSRYRFANNFNRQRDRVSKQTIIDANAVPRLIGHKGKTINQFRDQYHVDVRFNSDPNNPDVVIISGASNKIVDDAIEALVQSSIDVMSNEGRNYGTSAMMPNQYEDDRHLDRNQVPPDTSDLNDFPLF